MPHLSSIAFTKCRFTDIAGATGFAKALVARQARLMKNGGTRTLEKISFRGTEGDIAIACAERLRNSEVMKGVEVSVCQ